MSIRVKIFLTGLIAGFLVITGLSGMGFAATETVDTFGLIESLSAPSTTLASSFNNGSVVYVRVDNGGTTRGSTTPSKNSTVQDDSDITNQINFTVYDDGTFPDNKPNDGYYWGCFTLEEDDGTPSGNGILRLADGETATIACNLDDLSGTGTTQITADFAPEDNPPGVATFTANPNPFSPNGDGVQDTTDVSYTLSDNISTSLQVRLEVRDTSSTIVRTLLDAQTQDTGKVYTSSWDGCYDDGSPAPDGDYTCRIMIIDGAGNYFDSTLGLEIDTAPPLITDVSVSPNPFSPNSDGVKDTTTISFSLSGAATGGNRVEVRNASGNLVRRLDDEISPTSGGENGDNSLIWDGKDSRGENLLDGSYHYEIWAQDDAGNMNEFTGQMYVDTTIPCTGLQVLDNDRTHTSPFDAPDLGSSSPTGLYISDTQVGGEWQTSDASGIYEVKVVIDGETFIPQNPNGNWEGWFLYWTPPASSGEYEVLVRAIDNAGNDTGASGQSTSIVYDSEPPTSQISSPPDGVRFNSSTLTVKGTATDGEGAGVGEVQVQVTNLETMAVIESFATGLAADTSLEGDFSSWEYVFNPPDSGSPPVDYLIESRAVDNLYEPTSPTSSSHIQMIPYSITVTYDTENLPYHPTNLEDDGIPLSEGHIFGVNNRLTATQGYFSGLKEVVFEYKLEPDGSWQAIGASPYTGTPPESYLAEVEWDTAGISTDYTYSFRAVAVSGDTGETRISSTVYHECRIDNSPPAAPYDLKDDGDLITSGHLFGKINALSCSADVEDASLWGVRFEYRDYTTSSSWASIGVDTRPEGDRFSVFWDTSSLSETHTYRIRATAIDAASNSTSSTEITDCKIDHSPPVFQSLSTDRDGYRNGEVVIITANLDAPGYEVSCDFSSLDSEYGEGDNIEEVADNLDSTYTISYQIHHLNTMPDSSYTVLVCARDSAENETTSSISVVLNNGTLPSPGPDTPPGPVIDIQKVSLDYEGETVYNIQASVQVTCPSVFVNDKVDTVSLKALVGEDAVVSEASANISLYRVEKIYTENIKGEPVEGECSVEYDEVENALRLYFYLDPFFNPEEDKHQNDGLYWVQAKITGTSGITSELSFFFIYDTTPPRPPDFKMDSFDSTTGYVSISGVAYSDLSDPQYVRVFVNGTCAAEAESQVDGNFSVHIKLNAGRNTIGLRTEDRAGNKSQFTSPLETTYNPERLFSILVRSCKVLRSASSVSPVRLLYYLSEPAEVSICIYNLVGEVVYRWQRQVVPGDEEEWCWWGKNMFGEGVNNGMYIMKATAQSASRKEIVTKLVGVLR